MSLNKLNYDEILNDFPSVKLSYENIIHKKVYNSDYVTAIPEGNKCFAWFTNYRNQDVCFIMDLLIDNNSFKITNIKIMKCCFTRELSYGTILYGTQFYKDNTFFTIENVLYYKGKIVSTLQWGKKLQIINEIMTNHIKQQSYNNSYIVFGLPLIKNNIDDLLKEIKNVTYQIEKIQFILFKNVNILLYIPYKNIDNILINNKLLSTYTSHLSVIKNNSLKQIENLINQPLSKPIQREIIDNKKIDYNKIDNKKLDYKKLDYKKLDNKKIDNKIYVKKEYIFNVKPDIQNDIYHLYCDDNNSEKLYDIAYIPDYNKSVFMNKLFRKIKENDNLDALEESDDEDEFEDDRPDKFVYLDKSYKMYCTYNNKFKKWVPHKIANENEKLVNRKELNEIYINGKNKQ